MLPESGMFTAGGSVAATKASPGLDMIATHGDVYKVVRLDVATGARYPWLERIPNTDDYLTPILAPRTK